MSERIIQLLAESGGCDEKFGCDYVLVILTAPLIQQLLEQQAHWQTFVQQARQQGYSPFRMHCWTHLAQWLGDPWSDLADATSVDLLDWLKPQLGDEASSLLTDLENGHWIELPEELEIPEMFSRRTELEQLVYDADGDLWFKAYPRHAPLAVDSPRISPELLQELLEQAGSEPVPLA